MSFFQKRPWGARQVNLESEGSIRPDGLQNLLEAMRQVVTGLIDPTLVEVQEEGSYDPETMTWNDSSGGRHSQRCNARRLAEKGNHPDAPDFY